MTVQSQPIILSVSEITQAIKLTLESTFPRVWVKGEVTNPKLNSSGHFYFTLKDEYAQISAVCFRLDMTKVPILPKAGDQLMVRAEMNVWPPKGGYQLVVREMAYVGVGEQLIKLELLKQKLQKLGFFSLERKRTLPRFPKCIGIVTSPTGAVIQDVLNILTRRMVGFYVMVNPVRVQGEGAEIEIAQAINQFNRYSLADVLVVCRGGGSFEDLAPFNSELVAQAIFQSEIPIVSAVGHETDFTIADMVADVRAPTPSAAAELISHEQEVLLDKLAKYGKQIAQLVQKELKRKQQDLVKLSKLPLLLSASYFLGSRMQLVDDLGEQIDAAMKRKLQLLRQDMSRYKKSLEVVRPSNRIKERRALLVQLDKSIQLAMTRLIKTKMQRLLMQNSALNARGASPIALKKKAFLSCQFPTQLPNLLQKALTTKRRSLETIKAQLEALDPKKVLAKGYSILFSQKDGSVISSVTALHIGQEVRVAFVDGDAEAKITTIRVKHEQSNA